MTRCVRMAKTLLIQKADAVASVVRTTFALTLCIQKKFALRFCVCKMRCIQNANAMTPLVPTTSALTFYVCNTRTAFKRQMP